MRQEEQLSRVSNGYPAEFMQISEKNRKACKRFEQALEAFSRNDFCLASRYMQGFRNLVKYDEFYRNDNRTVQTPLASVIVVGYNTGSDLLACIKSIFAGSEKCAEVIIVDNGQNATLLPVLPSLPLLYVKAPMNFFPSEGRNIGAAFSNAPIVFFLDDDGIAHPDFIKNGLEAFKESTIHAIRGKIHPKTQQAYCNSRPHYNLGEVPFCTQIGVEGNSAWRKESYKQAGGMDPLLFGHEGIDLSNRLEKNQRHASFYWPSMVIYHDYANTPQKHERKERRHLQMRNYLLWKEAQETTLVELIRDR